MERIYSSGKQAENPKFFIGVEVEHTSNFGKRTLFCRGDATINEIVALLDGIEHVYLNHNHTVLKDEEVKISALAAMGIPITIERNVNEWQGNNTSNPLLTWLISVPIADVERNDVFVKIDDTGFNSTNSGVWTMSHNDFTGKTDWEQYKDDTICNMNM